MPAFPLTATDARGRTVTLPNPPQRIVSLVPSQTELLAHLGLAGRVVGLTRFCTQPDGWKDEKAIVGGTKNVNVERVAALEPDFVLANHEENTRPVVEALDAVCPVYVTEVATVPDAAAMMRAVGRLTGTAAAAKALADDVEAGFAALGAAEPVRVAYLIWQEPLMTVGAGTFIHDVLTRGSFENVFAGRTRYPEVTEEDLAAAAPDWVFLSSEPFPFSEEHAEALRPALPDARVRLVDGALFSWYGPRLLQTPAYLRHVRQGMTGPTV